MLSRVEESIHWMNRYIERAESIARFVDVNLQLMLDLPPGLNEQWMPLIQVTADDEAFAERYGEPTRENVIGFLTFDEDNPNSILQCLRGARENARSIRETISSEMWEHLNTFYLLVRSADFRRLIAGDPSLFFNRIKNESHLFAGVTDATMSHGEGWHFGRLGRMIERADKTSRILDVKYYILLPKVADVGTPFDELQWSALLRSTSGLEMYRKRFGRITPDHVAEFLILDLEFPRSIQFCLVHAEDSLRAITGSPPGRFHGSAEQRLGRLRSRLAYTRIEEIIAAGLHEFLDLLQAELNAIGEGILERFFAMGPVGDIGTARAPGTQ